MQEFFLAATKTASYCLKPLSDIIFFFLISVMSELIPRNKAWFTNYRMDEYILVPKQTLLNMT